MHNRTFDWSKLKAYADINLNVTEKLFLVLGRVQNSVGTGENAGLKSAFSPFPTMFLKVFCLGVFKSRDYVVKS